MMSGWMLAASLVLAVWYWAAFASAPEGRTSWTGSLVKTGATGLLALGFAVGGAPWALIIGLALGAFGDFALSRPSQRWFLAGMAAFAAGHLIYVAWIWGESLRLGGPSFGLGTGIAIAALAALVISTEKWLAPHTGALRAPVRAYVGVITLMGAAVLVLPPSWAGRFVQLGAALFILSDLILAIRLFRTRDPVRLRQLGALVWPLYFAGQAMIVHYGSLVADLPRG